MCEFLCESVSESVCVGYTVLVLLTCQESIQSLGFNMIIFPYSKCVVTITILNYFYFPNRACICVESEELIM